MPRNPQPPRPYLDDEVREALHELRLASREVDTRPPSCDMEELLRQAGRDERALQRWTRVRELASRYKSSELLN